MRELVVVRHGQTEWSASGRFTGRTDLPLTREGEEQAKELGRMLAPRSFGLVLTSPLMRAWKTGVLAGVEAVAEPDLAEWDYGEYEGLRTADMRRRIPGWSIWTHPPQRGESLDELAARADRVIDRVRAVDGDVAVFGHSHALRVLAARWLDLPPMIGSGFVLETGALGILGWDRDLPAVLHWNQTCQLRAKESLN